MKQSRRVIASAVALALVSQVPLAQARSNGPAAQPADGSVAIQARQLASSFPAPLQPLVEALYRDGEWNAVLNFEQLGLAAMETGERELAKRSFDEAIARIETIYADDDNARHAKSVFSEEKVKDFKGEPYERAMAYFYRGLLYAADGDYQNARAAFLAADRQDTMSEQESFAADFGMMKYMAGWASYCDKDPDRGRALVSEAKSMDATLSSFPSQPPASIVLVDTGTSPEKVGTGKYREILTFNRGAGATAVDAMVGTAGETPAPFVAIGDVFFQASTRGGRPIDGILNGKAHFKDDAQTIGDVASQAGQIAAMAGANSGNRGLAGAGLLGMLVGLVAQGVAAATTPAADVRRWSSLPDSVSMLAGRTDVEPTAVRASGSTMPIRLAAKSETCRLAWTRTASALPSTLGGTAEVVTEPAAEEGREARNATLRAMLDAELAETRRAVTAEAAAAPR